MNLRIGWDFDGLFVEDRCPYFLDYLIRVESWSVDKEAFAIAGNFLDATGKVKVEVDDAYNRFLKSSHAPMVVPIAYARHALHRLQGRCTSHLVTSRKDHALLEAVEIIERHFGISFASYNGGLFGLKLSMMRQRDLRVLVDDNPHEAAKIVSGLSDKEDRFVIQFPSFHLGSPNIAHPRVIRPPICDEVHDIVMTGKVCSEERKARIFEESWLQVTQHIERLAYA